MPIVAAYAVPHPPLIIPSVGGGREEGIARTVSAYREIAREIADIDPEVLIVTSPHAPCYRDGFYVSTGVRAWGSMVRFGAASTTVEVGYDQALSSRIRSYAEEANLPLSSRNPRDSELDHATFIPLWFVQRAYEDSGKVFGCKLVRIGLSGMGYEAHRAMGRSIAKAVDDLDCNVVFIASGDLSHKLTTDGPYGFAQEGPQFDQQICDIFQTGGLEKLFAFDPAFADKAAECGLQSFQMMAATLACDNRSWVSELLSYEGPFGVGYGVVRLLPEVAAEVDPYVALARQSVEHFVTQGCALPLPDNLLPEMTNRQAGAFVSLHKRGKLRGCMGTIAGTQNTLAEEIIRNGILACSQDPRFTPVMPDELDYLEYSVDVLGEPELISGPEALDPKRYGVIVSTRYQRGLLLPNLEGVDTVEMQVDIARQKAGIHPRQTDVLLQRFEVVRHELGGRARK